MKRRTFLAGSAAAAAVGLTALRPRDRGAPYSDYFQTLNHSLRETGPMRPVMIVDLDRVDKNIDLISQSIAPGKALRVVAKSLPAPGLIDYVSRRAKTQRLMSFHLPFLLAQTRAHAKADILMGKPMPVAGADQFYAAHIGPFDAERQLQWLIDSPQRLAGYLALARGRKLLVTANIELDVGLHRGGVSAGPDLAAMIDMIAENTSHLRFGGFMGYDPHVVKVPRLLASRDTLLQRSLAEYQAAIDLVRERQPQLWHDGLTLNTAGSPTYRLHQAEKLSNDIAVGSAVVMPSDFDIDTLSDHRAASFIASPVLKASDGLNLPGLDDKSRLLSTWDVNQRRSYFLYGGYWKAQPESPPGLAPNPLFGRSTNQELLTGSPRTALKVDDHVFLRPTQSEFVFLQFGDLLAVRNGQIVESWPVYDQSGAAPLTG